MFKGYQFIDAHPAAAAVLAALAEDPAALVVVTALDGIEQMKALPRNVVDLGPPVGGLQLQAYEMGSVRMYFGAPRNPGAGVKLVHVAPLSEDPIEQETSDQVARDRFEQIIRGAA